MLRIRQVVLAARDLRGVPKLEQLLGNRVCYRDPEVRKFGLENALLPIGHQGFVQFLEVVAPVESNTAAGRHLERHGESGYMLILQTDDLTRDRARLASLGVRIVWEAAHADIHAVHLHPKDIGGAIVSLDQATPPKSWRWAGPNWRDFVSETGAQKITAVTIGARNPRALAAKWAQVLNTSFHDRGETVSIEMDDGVIRFIAADADILQGFDVTVSGMLPTTPTTVALNGVAFSLTRAV